jgi:septum formation protein
MEPPLVLASASPRRRQILATLGLPFEAIAVDLDEEPIPGERPGALAHRLARGKAILGAQQRPYAVVIGADTVVELDGESLGKPASPEEAFETLVRLRNRPHRVITSVAVAMREEGSWVRTWSDDCVTQVRMRPYSDDEIRAYIATGDPFDKAGSYAIQHPTFHPVAAIEGCYLNVVGFPLPTLRNVLVVSGEIWFGLSRAVVEQVCAGCTDLDILTKSEGPAR